MIGILSLPNEYPGFDQYRSYFPASYVKFVEQWGGRAVPIPYTQDLAVTKQLVKNLNGFLFTGGGAEFFHPNGSLTQYAATANVLFEETFTAAAAGEWVPLWGTCLGHELTLSLAAMNATVLSCGFDSENISLPLQLEPAAATSRLYSTLPADAVEILQTQAVTLNAHGCGIAPADFARFPSVTQRYRILGIGYDRGGKPFVSTAEAINAPSYTTQFHPEKVSFEWNQWEAIVHNESSAYANAQFARFFINEARKNERAFPTYADSMAAAIYEYNATYVYNASGNTNFVQVYFFE